MSLVRRTLTTTAATVSALALLSGTALAHDCFLGTPTTQAPKSGNWHTITAEEAAGFIAGYAEPCEGATAAGYAALREAGLPSSIRVFVGGPDSAGHFVLGGKSQTRADGKGLEAFPDSALPFQMVNGFVAGAHASCDSGA
jgi:hypothetical protein